RGPEEGDQRGVVRSGLAALLCALPAQRTRLPAEEGRRRLPAGAALDLRPARLAGSQPRPGSVDHQVAGQVPETGRLGREQHRRNLELLPAAPGAPQALEEHQHARAAQRGIQAAHARGEDLPEHRVVPAADSGAVRRNPRDVARGQPLPEHGPAGRAEEGAVETGRLTAAAVLGASGYALRTDHGNPESIDYLINPFAQLDAHNGLQQVSQPFHACQTMSLIQTAPTERLCMTCSAEHDIQIAHTTAHHAKYFAWELTRRRAASEEDRLAQSLFDASVDLNPHQIDAALFALNNPLSKGVVL